jgi:amino acid adenylation domain-containing protein
LTLSLGEADGALVGSLQYNTDLFDEATVARLARQYETLLEGVVADPTRRVFDLPLSNAADRAEMASWVAGANEPTRTRFLHESFEAHAAQAPAHPALRFDDESISYAALNRRANRLARRLRALGVGPDRLVGICVPRSVEMVVAVLGVMKAGAAYLPLDPSYPAERLAFMVEDAEIDVLVTASGARAAVPDFGGERVVVGGGATTEEEEPNVPVALSPENLAYVIYTSGSTGRPKGAAVRHAGLANMCDAQALAFGVRPSDRVLQFASLSFDASIFEIALALASGATLEMGTAGTMASSEDLARLIRAREVTIATLPPSMLAVLPGPFPSLRTIISAGESCTPTLVRAWRSDRCSFENAYGPTETTVWATVKSCGADDLVTTIGHPVRNARAYVLDPSLAEAPIGASGELYIGGAGLARGYVGRPALTAERFLPDPCSPTPGARMYRTGDRARWRESGEIEFLGRADHQVKVRGFRIELGEVEAALEEHPAVRQGVVVGRRDGSGSTGLVGYVVRREPTTPLGSSELRRHLARTLPEHMIPSAIVVLDEWPLTPNGKIDRRKLPDPGAIRAHVESEFVAPRTAVEAEIQRVWSSVLDVSRVGVHDDFFVLGGHSLIATQLVSRVRDAFGVDLPLRALFEAPSVAGMAAAVEEALGAGSASGAPPLVRVERRGDAPVSFAQRRMWFLDQLSPGSAAYNVPLALHVRGALDREALRRSFEEIVRRHKVLRTAIVSREGEPVQVVAPCPPWDLPVMDLAGLDGPAREARVAALAADDAARPFDLGTAPLLRTTLLRLGEDEHVLLLAMHHVVADGWSFGVLVEEMSALHSAFRKGEPSSLPELPIQYADFAHWQRRWLAGDVLEAQLGYWREKLRGAPLLELPSDRPRSESSARRGAHMPLAIPRDVADGITGLSRDAGATLFMTLLAAFQVLLHRYSGQSDVSVGTPIANRSRTEIEPLIGFFVNTLVMRADLTDDPTFAQMLERTRKDALNAFTHQDVPFEKVVEAIGLERDLTRTPLFQVMFALQSAPVKAATFDGLTVAPLDVESGAAKFDLSLALNEVPEGLRGTLEYDADLFDAATITRLAGSFETLLRAIVRDPARRISALPLLEDDDRSELLAASGGEIGPFESTACIHELFEAQVTRSPDAVAVTYEDEALTYAALNARANQLARELRGHGVGPEVVVGICLPRSAESIVAILGVLKAGGAYVPLDPADPGERLSHVLESAGARVLVTHAALGAQLTAPSIDRVCLDADRARLAAHDAGNLASVVDPTNLAYVIYTSGSTGRPKGVMVQHRSVLNLLAGLERAAYAPVGGAARVTLNASYTFDASVQQWLQLLAGRAVSIVPQHVRVDAGGMTEFLARSGVDVLDCTPSQLVALLDAEPDATILPRLVLVGGEAIDRALWTRLGAIAGTRFVNVYGPTECTVDATFQVVESHALPGIGAPLANVSAHVLDDALTPVPMGVAGEIYIGGEAVSRGYLGQPAMTADRFVPNPFGEGDRLYRTGDRGRRRRDGTLDFLGRVDHQVKIRGYRIELGEIEVALATHPSVKQAVVVAREDSPGYARLVAYVTPSGATEPAPDALRQHLALRLPPYMVPATFVALRELPLSSNRKVNRKALPPPPKMDAERTTIGPRTPAELALTKIWEELLGVEPVGVQDDFFAIGGHSLLALRVLQRTRQELGSAPRLADFFRAPTIEAVASRARRGGRAAPSSPVLPLRRSGNDVPLVCVHAIGGSALVYRDLARHLGDARPVLALHAPGVDDDEEPSSDVVATAKRYVASLREAGTPPPYHLAGWSFGGLVAFEMARQLVAAGERVGRVVLIDSRAPRLGGAEVAVDDRRLLGILAYELAIPCDHARLVDLPLEEAIAEIGKAGRAARVLPDGDAEAIVRRWLRVYRAHWTAAKRYAPGGYDGEVTLLRAQDLPEEEAAASDATFGWRAHATVDVRSVPGNHFSLLTSPNVEELARTLGSVLGR